MVPVGERAPVPMGGEVCLEPPPLRRPAFAAADVVAVRVQHDHMPGTERIAVPALLRQPEEADRDKSCSRVVLMVSERGPDSRHKSSPARVEAVGEIVCGAVVVRDVSQHGDRPTQRRDEGRGLLVTVGRARGDVTDCDQRCWAGSRVRAAGETERAGERDGRSSTLRRHRRATLRRSGSRSAPLLS